MEEMLQNSTAGFSDVLEKVCPPAVFLLDPGPIIVYAEYAKYWEYAKYAEMANYAKSKNVQEFLIMQNVQIMQNLQTKTTKPN